MTTLTDVFQDILSVQERYTNDQIAALEQRLRRKQTQATQYTSWPLEITDTNAVLAEGRQVVLHTLTIATGAKLTVKGILRILGEFTNRGTLVITSTGCVIRG